MLSDSWEHFFSSQSSKSAERKAVSRPGAGLDGDLSGQGGAGEPSELLRGCGSSGVTAGTKGEMEFGPNHAECLLGAGGEMEEPLSAHFSRKTAIMSQFESKALGLDKAILHSIDCCGKIRRTQYVKCKNVSGFSTRTCKLQLANDGVTSKICKMLA